MSIRSLYFALVWMEDLMAATMNPTMTENSTATSTMAMVHTRASPHVTGLVGPHVFCTAAETRMKRLHRYCSGTPTLTNPSSDGHVSELAHRLVSTLQLITVGVTVTMG